MNPITIKLLIFVGIVAGSFFLGWFVAQALRLREYATKISLLCFTLLFALSPFINAVVDGKPWTEALRFGIDLAGGTNLIYQLERLPNADNPGTMENLVGAIRRRIDPSGTQELAIRQVGKDRIEVIIPKASPEAIANIKAKMTRIGSLEFALLANNRDDAELIARAQKFERDVRQNGRLVAGWRPVAPLMVEQNGKMVPQPNPDFSLGETSIGIRQIKGQPDGFLEVLCKFEPEESRRVTGKFLIRAAPDMDETGRPAVSFAFNQRGGYLFSRLTSANIPTADGFHRRLSILLDDKIHSAPSINTTIGANGIIQGRFTPKEVQDLVDVLNAGALDVPLKPDPISEFTISPLLGVDVQNKGITALALAMVGVFLFMLIYYFFVLGFVANLCLVLNLILLMGVMAIIEATFTLPGLAGIVLTMGMAVDANVLIYERMREELAKGSSFRMAIHNGFSRAFSSIFDANITTLLTAVILYMIGSDQVKGFAVSLFIGLAISMYTALTVNRMILEICEKKRWVKQVSIINLFGQTNFDFVSKQVFCAVFSMVVISIGLVAFFQRGEKGYDIDFTGGTMLTMQFNEPQNADDVRNKLTEAFGSEITLEELSISAGADSKTAAAGNRFRVRTTEQDESKVRQTVSDAFKDKLKRIELTSFTPLVKITPETAPAADSTPDAAKPADPAKPEETPAEDVAVNPFIDGYQSDLAFSTDVTPDTITRYFSEELVKLKGADGKPTYGSDVDELSGLFQITGKGAVATESGSAGKVQIYKDLTLKTEKAVAEGDVKTALEGLKVSLAASPVFDEVNNFESQVAQETKQSAVIAMLASLIMIVIYIWYRFENVYFGFAAVLALAHDVLVTLGMVSLAAYAANTAFGNALLLNDFKINLTMIAAFLTIVGYSLNDTIVIFDRIREIKGKNPDITREMINLAVNQTLSRTILTAGTVFVTVVILYALGGEGIHGFAYAMLIGTIVGSYSTIFVASPAVLWFMHKGATSAPAQAKNTSST